MKLILCFLIVNFLTPLPKMKCTSLHRGVFMLTDINGSDHIITRNDSTQIESVENTGNVTEYNIKWTSDCTYLLYDRRVIKGTDVLHPEIRIDTLYNEIIEIKNKKHIVRSIMRGYDFTADAELTLIKKHID